MTFPDPGRFRSDLRFRYHREPGESVGIQRAASSGRGGSTSQGGGTGNTRGGGGKLNVKFYPLPYFNP